MKCWQSVGPRIKSESSEADTCSSHTLLDSMERRDVARSLPASAWCLVLLALMHS